MALIAVADVEARFPELITAGGALIQECIRGAVDRLNSDTWGALYREGLLYMTAHLLALSPYGQEARMVSDRGLSTYRLVYDDLANSLGASFQVL